MPVGLVRPTGIARTSCTLLDNFLTTILMNFNAGILNIDITDHLPIFLVYESYFKNVKLVPKELEYRVLNELTLGNFYCNFTSLNMHDVLDEADVSRGAELLQCGIPTMTAYLKKRKLFLSKIN